MKKVILFDADGVVIKKRKEFFSDTFVREQGVSSEGINSFFKNRFHACQIGKADIKEELEPLLPAWGWDKSVEEYLDYWFTTDVILDDEVLGFVEECRGKGIKCYLATDQEKYRAIYFREQIGLDKYFDGCFFSYELGATKSQSEFFKKVLEKLNVSASDVAYTDDDQKNVDVAQSLGIASHFFTDIENLRKFLQL
ncbi:MAG: HAD-IA family hydrolase [Candidatus Adlerbacteria bacterium]